MSPPFSLGWIFIWLSQFFKFLLMNDTRIIKVYFNEFVKNFFHLIGVKGGDSGGKSVSRCDPAESESERGGTRTTRGKRPPVTEIDRISDF